MHNLKALSLLFIFLSLMGCQSVQNKNTTIPSRIETANQLAAQNQLAPLILQTDLFQLHSYYRIEDSKRPLRIYIEGDGQAWVTRSRISNNPTPIQPLALELASEDRYPNVLYIARPCQYRTTANCSDKYWSNARFSADVIHSMDQAISTMTRHFNPPSIELIGFSGGAAVAILVASKRKDVTRIITVAGNLDHERVNTIHNVDQIPESLNAIDVAKDINTIPQHHFVGSQDNIIPVNIAKAFIAVSQPTDKIQLSVIEGLTHIDGWKKKWPALLKQI